MLSVRFDLLDMPTHRVRPQFMMMVFFRVLTPLQLANVAAQTAPTNKLDTLALAKCAAPLPLIPPGPSCLRHAPMAQDCRAVQTTVRSTNSAVPPEPGRPPSTECRYEQPSERRVCEVRCLRSARHFCVLCLRCASCIITCEASRRSGNVVTFVARWRSSGGSRQHRSFWSRGR